MLREIRVNAVFQHSAKIPPRAVDQSSTTGPLIAANRTALPIPCQAIAQNMWSPRRQSHTAPPPAGQALQELFEAAGSDRYETVKRLCSSAASDTAALKQLVNSQDRQGMTALAHACKRGQGGRLCAKELLQRNAVSSLSRVLPPCPKHHRQHH